MKAELARARILNAFRARVRQHGLREVTMSDLVADLGISTKTLYRHFRNKGDVVSAFLQLLSVEFVEHGLSEDWSSAAKARSQIVELICWWHEMWSAFPQNFWTQLETDHPEAYARFREMLDAEIGNARHRFSKFLKPGIPKGVADMILDAATQAARDDDWLRGMNLTYRDAVIGIVELWAFGSMEHESGPVEPYAAGNRAKPDSATG
ncbi:TetR/AcrR family transcriptional regulator [Novosphingobium sp.]|uniref:TetR/AcrR family transcriptional regulator n=1 Tax=Novosphingobium sp. TaxID=1874826 RepID=UPI003BAD92E3